MNESIIRRFARYHGVELVVHEYAVHWALEEIAIALHGSVAPHCVLKVAQSITRIEDAEMLLRRVEDVPPGPASRGAKLANSVHQQAAYDLLCLADIDPFKWLEVKE